MVAISGGDKLDEFLRRTAKNVSRPGTLRVGFLENATYPDGTSVALVAATQNFGAPARGIPPRPFFSNMVAEKSPDWPDKLLRLLKSLDYDAPAALQYMGQGIAGQLREAVVALDAPALSAVTLMLRKMRAEDPNLIVTGAVVGEAARKVAAGEDYSGVSTKPLVDTGHMLASIDYEVDGS